MKNYYLVFKRMMLVALLLATFNTYASGNENYFSEITVKGVIVDEAGEPVFATVTVKGGNHATSTNFKGEFVLKNVMEDAVLIISGVNIETFEVDVNRRADLGTIKVTMKISKDKEVVVEANTGYYSVKPNEINGSVVVIDNKTLNQQTGTSILNRLKGVTSGLAFNTKNSNNPQSDLGITIRGVSTINGPLNPLIVLDNFIYEGDLRNINPNDIESITVLKDAAATSIYGARGGNGVIVITSKKGKINQPVRIEFNSTLSVTDKPNLYYLPQISSSDYIDVEQFLYKNGYYDDLINYDWYYHSAFTPALQTFIQRSNGKITAADSAATINSLKNIDSRDQYNKYLFNRPVTQQYSVNISGGSQKNAYYLSAGYDRNLSDVSEQFNKINLKIQNTFKPVKNLQIDIGAFYTNSDYVSGKPTSVLIGGKHVPYLKLATDAGVPLSVPVSYGDAYTDTAGNGKLLSWKYLPLEDYKHDRLTTGTEQLIANIGLKYQILKGLDIDLKYQYERQQAQTRRLSDTSAFYARDLINKFSQIDYSTGIVNYIVPKAGILQLDNSDDRSDNWRGQINYHFKKGRSYLSVLAGAETRRVTGSSNSSTVYGYNADPLTTAAVDYVNQYPTYIDGSYQGIPGSPGLSSTADRFVSLYSNLSYLYNDRLSLSGSARKDGANIFGANTNEKWKPLWSLGGGWVVSKEKFYKYAAIPYLKLRATVGISGNVDLTKIPLPIARYSTDPNTNLSITRIMTINNPDLRWEQSRQINFGFEFSSARQRLTGSLDYYIKTGTDLYGEAPYDYTAFGSQSTIIKNVASTRGHGIDLNLQSRNIDKTFKWSTVLLLNFNTAKTTKYFTSAAENGLNILGGGNYITPAIGKPLYSIAALKWEGLDNVGDPQGFLDGKKSKDYAAILSDVGSKGLESGSVVYIGSATPEIFGSLINTFSWKSLSASINIGYEFGYYFIRPSLSYSSLYNYGTGTADFKNRWQKPGDENITDVPAMVYTSYPQFSNRDAFYSLSENHVSQGGNVRINYINLSYNFLKSKSGLNTINIYLNASNPGIIWRANHEGLDPDYPASIPPAQIYSIGIRASF